MESYDQILNLRDLIATNGVAWSNIVPPWPDSTKWERYGQLLYVSDLVATNGEVWLTIVPKLPDSTKWRGMVKYCTLVTW